MCKQKLLQYLSNCKVIERERVLPNYKYMEAETKHTADFTEWRSVCIPIITVHLLDLDTHAADPSFVDSRSAMHYVNIVVPFALTLVDRVWDLNELINDMTTRVKGNFSSTERGAELLLDGSLEYYTGHHKKRQYEYGGTRFVIAACRSDRPAAILEYTDSAGKKTEVLH